MNNLGKWVVLDIESTGIDPTSDEIIDIGFLQFEGTKLVRKFSSLVRPKNTNLSEFIRKLTGLKPEMFTKAPFWEQVQSELWDLESHTLLAHNASFEENFLKKHFENNQVEAPIFLDS
ncbi:MAG: 3'-5' exonuclease, partial [Bacteriovoracaceae bacterium]|nr:3'-5' exonuclease [Bacteriovoracaceae bacterium]